VTGLRASDGPAARHVTAREAGLVGCVECGLGSPLGTGTCPRCESRLAPSDRSSLAAVWALLIAGMIAYVPANLYPMLITRLFGRTTESTILAGIFDLADHGSLGVAMIVFVASVVIPIGKFIAIGYLATVVSRGGVRRTHHRHRLYEIVDFIGRWSMVDVFVIAILASLVQLDFVATIQPGVAAVSFALSVVFTMLSARAFDTRLIWAARAGAA
jgi:paraquat-inducible protein A